MGIREELTASFGEDFFTPSATATPAHNWLGICVCGHLDRYHSPDVGGTYNVPEPTVVGSRTEYPVTVTQTFHGCTGALNPRGFTRTTETVDREAGTHTIVINPTCPCTQLRVVVNVDRPNRYFNQRMPQDPTEQQRHPFMTGVRAFTTHLSRRKQAIENPHWLDAEFERRFTWAEDVRHCSISSCRASGSDVWPTFVTDELLSELRCGAHRRP